MDYKNFIQRCNLVSFSQVANQRRYLSTGILPLDAVITGYGIPSGKLVYIYGPPASGKSTIVEFLVRETIKNGGIPCSIDVEHGTDIFKTQQEGVDNERFFMPHGMEKYRTIQACMMLIEEMLEEAMKFKGDNFCTIALDSVAAAMDKEKKLGEFMSHSPEKAKFLSQALSKLCGMWANANCFLIFVNQLRQRLNFSNIPQGFLSQDMKETCPGGEAVDYFAAVTLRTKRRKVYVQDGNPIGVECDIEVKKNKVGIPFRKVRVPFFFGKGFDNNQAIKFYLEDKKIMAKSTKKRGAWELGDNLIRDDDWDKKMEDDKFYAYVKGLILKDVGVPIK